MTPRCALITGASSGIGTAFAHALPNGTDLVLTGRDEDRLKALTDALTRGLPDRRVTPVVADLATDRGRTKVIKAAAAAEIDLLVNNAGLGRGGRVIDNPAEAEAEMVQVNVLAPTVLTRALLPHMVDRAKAGHSRCGVIILASLAAFMPLPYLGTYAATKAFDLHYAEALAAEMKGAPVDVLAVCPGPVATNFFARAGMNPDRMGGAVAPDRVAREALQALGRKTVHVVGGRNKLSSLLPRLAPRDAVSYGASLVMKGMGGDRR